MEKKFLDNKLKKERMERNEKKKRYVKRVEWKQGINKLKRGLSKEQGKNVKKWKKGKIRKCRGKMCRTDAKWSKNWNYEISKDENKGEENSSNKLAWK